MKAKQRAAGCKPARTWLPPDAGASQSCRICFEEGCNPNELVSPCLCKGTQKYVHVKCLRRWQDSVQRHMHRKDKLDDRAYRCGVCREMYSMPPRIFGGQVWATLRAMAATSAIAVLALGLSGGPPWPHLAIAFLVLLGARSSSLLCVLALVLACALATLHARGLRVVMRVDAMGRLGMAVIRHGGPVEGMHTGVLLAASEGLERSIFRRSVILVYEHSARSGARGVILSQPLGPADPRLAPSAARAQQGPSALPHGVPSLSHFLGGPVGMPGDGPGQEVAVIHTLAEVPGARPLLAPNRTHEGGGPPAMNQQLFEGGSLADVVAAAMAASPQQPPATAAGNAADRWPHRAGRAGERQGTPPQGRQPSVHVYHGVCAWSEGQLEGELRSGAWGFSRALLEDVLSVPPEQLWLRLTTQPGRLTWLRR